MCLCIVNTFVHGILFEQGFPYMRELYIAGHIFRALSMAALLTTIIALMAIK